MLQKRTVISKLREEEVRVNPIKGCPQGSAISPLLWTLVFDDLLQKLENNGIKIQAFADDIVLLFIEKCGTTIKSLIQQGLNLITCEEQGLGSLMTVRPIIKKRY